MSKSLVPISQLAGTQPYDEAHNNPFQAFGSIFSVSRQGDQVWHRETRLDEKRQTIYQTEAEALFAVGSGTHGCSYLTVLGDGYLFQTPVSWFTQKHIWDVSPGFSSDLKRRVVTQDCMFCHANRTVPREEYLNRYETPLFSEHAIGCERCHGPGELHIRNPGFQPASGAARGHLKERVQKADFTIVNPRKLRFDLAEAICQQCHLGGEARTLRGGRGLYDFRPGMELDRFWSIFVHPQESGHDRKFVNHVEQMYISRCFKQSSGDDKLGCTSCHDPHQAVSPAERRTYFRERCLRCHSVAAKTEPGIPCAVPLAQRITRNQDNCAACHMPPYASSDIAHSAATDHRIVRRPVPSPHGDEVHSGSAPLVHFQRGKVDAEDHELSRDLGVALIQAVVERKVRGEVLPGAIDLLERALLRFPQDTTVWEIKAAGLLAQKRYSASLAAAQSVLAKTANREKSLVIAGMSAQMLGKLDLSASYWRRAVAMNPWMANYRENLTKVLAATGFDDDMILHCRAWIRLSPASFEARKLLIEQLVRTGKREDARAEFMRLEALRPPDFQELRRWFSSQSDR